MSEGWRLSVAKGEERVQMRHPDGAKTAPRIEKFKYDAVRRAILKVVPRSEKGIGFKELPKKVGSLLPAAVKRRIGSVSWYTTVVKLDLEARREIRRIPGISPQRLRR